MATRIFIFLAGFLVGWAFLSFLAEVRMLRKIRSIQIEKEEQAKLER